MSGPIYILEDEPEIARIILRELEAHGMSALHFSSRAAFRREITRRRPALCLVDLTLPDGDGIDLVSDVLRKQAIPTIIVTGRDTVHDRVIGLELGADDYVMKPFEPRELVARVRALLRRSEAAANTAPSRKARFNDFLADFSSCELLDPEGQLHQLSFAETRLLQAFVEGAGRVLSRAQLLDIDGQSTHDPEDRSIDARISRLRKKLGDDPKSPRLIRTVYGAGYIFSAKVDWLGEG
ncbi:MAG: response regulator transcription factor [Neomegalonema sp.]|nr:response regulator transcription factor [Neomegalonema sp.]